MVLRWCVKSVLRENKQSSTAVVHRSHEPKVQGSNPCSASIFINDVQMKILKFLTKKLYFKSISSVLFILDIFITKENLISSKHFRRS